jgi:hypothetical protein
VFEQAAQTGFTPRASALTFGALTDVGSGWDGTVWAIDSAAARHVYDPIKGKLRLLVAAACLERSRLRAEQTARQLDQSTRPPTFSLSHMEVPT